MQLFSSFEAWTHPETFPLSSRHLALLVSTC